MHQNVLVGNQNNNDVLEFFLHWTDGATLGTIRGKNRYSRAKIINFQRTMVDGKYFIPVAKTHISDKRQLTRQWKK